MVSIPRKRSDNEDDGELAVLEQKVRSKGGKKGDNKKRQRTKWTQIFHSPIN